MDLCQQRQRNMGKKWNATNIVAFLNYAILTVKFLFRYLLVMLKINVR